MVYLGFSTTHGLGHPQGSWDVSLVDKGRPLHVHARCGQISWVCLSPHLLLCLEKPLHLPCALLGIPILMPVFLDSIALLRLSWAFSDHSGSV